MLCSFLEPKTGSNVPKLDDQTIKPRKPGKKRSRNVASSAVQHRATIFIFFKRLPCAVVQGRGGGASFFSPYTMNILVGIALRIQDCPNEPTHIGPRFTSAPQMSSRFQRKSYPTQKNARVCRDFRHSTSQRSAHVMTGCSVKVAN